ncbi:MAG TPA: hypothetical protein VHU80_06415 [Polyangiaceae bacterium]|jgi:hypothetical protein|nr:hypothetical protein [Polyangiaceae bacterium]
MAALMTSMRILETSSLALLFCAASACSRHDPEPESRPATTTSSASEPPPAQFLAPATASPHAEEPAAATDAKVVWSDPPGWTRLPQSSPMRMATYRVPHAGSDKDDAELAVFHFGGGQGGDVEANLKRWENQFSEKKAGAKRSERTVNGLKAHLLEIESGTYTAMAMMPGQSSAPKTDYGMIASVVETPAGSFFFKLTGPAKTIKSQRDAYMTLLDSVKAKG